MRAKLEVVSVIENGEGDNKNEQITFMAVTEKPYDQETGISEDNQFSKWTPSANLDMLITNPELFGKLKRGEKYYVDFTKAE